MPMLSWSRYEKYRPPVWLTAVAGSLVLALCPSSIIAFAGSPGASVGELPLRFEPNQGQSNAGVLFLARGNGYGLYLTAHGSVMVLRGAEPDASRVAVLRWSLLGAHRKPEASGRDQLPGKSHYFLGNDPERWRTNIPQYARVEFRDVYPGVDMAYYGREGQVEYDFVVAPDAEPKGIRFRVEGAQQVRLDENGDLILSVGSGEVIHRAPVVYQETHSGRRHVAGRYMRLGPSEIGFELGTYDRTRPLVIDPVLTFSTYLGGSLSDTNAGLAVDPSGNAYVIGITDSSNFPTMSPLQAAPAGGYEMVVAKLDPSGSALVYSTYLGGSGNDRGLEIAVDSSGNAYLTGDTTSVDFPTASPLQATYAGGYDAFVTKLDPSGSALVYSTYLGGSGLDTGEGIAVDSSGSVYLAGPTMSTDFPTVSPLQASYGGGTYDTFAAKLDPSGSALTYSTYLGGSSQDYGERIAVDPSGNAYVTGWTWSTDFPTANAFQPTKAGGNDAFVAKLNPSGTALVYSTYLGGSTDDYGEAIVADSSGNAYVTGHTYSGDFPTVSPLQAGLAGNNDVFVAKLDPSGSTLAYSTYLGGSSFDSPGAIVVDSSGHVHITGTTQSADFPTANPLQAAHAGSQDAFVAELNTSGSTLVFSTFLGGSANEWSSGIGLHSSGDSCVSGSTASVDFPTASPLQAAIAGGSMDFFIAKIEAPIFADDFESGDTSAWSGTVP